MSDEDPPRRRLSLAERVNEKVVQSQEKRRKRDVLEEEGWEEVAMADRSVAITYEPALCDADRVCALLVCAPDTTLSDLYFAVFSDDYVDGMLTELRRTKPEVFVQSRGRARHVTQIATETKHVHAALAMRIVLQAQQVRATRNKRHKEFLENRCKAAAAFLAQNANCLLPFSAQRGRKLISALQIEPGSDLETRLFCNLRALIVHLGEIFACDEKLFHADLLRSGMVKVVLSKPARVGIWAYQGCVVLEGNYPLCVHLRVHHEIANLDEKVRMITFIKEWAEIAVAKRISRHVQAVMVCDSHYPTVEALQYMRAEGFPFIFACDQQRFKSVSAIIADRVQKSGDHAYAEKAPERAGGRYELMSLGWSKDHKIGQRLTITNALKRTQSKRRQGHFPGFTGLELLLPIFAMCIHNISVQSTKHRLLSATSSMHCWWTSPGHITMAGRPTPARLRLHQICFSLQPF
jgi:hypothetical protein